MSAGGYSGLPLSVGYGLCFDDLQLSSVFGSVPKKKNRNLIVSCEFQGILKWQLATLKAKFSRFSIAQQRHANIFPRK